MTRRYVDESTPAGTRVQWGDGARRKTGVYTGVHGWRTRWGVRAPWYRVVAPENERAAPVRVAWIVDEDERTRA